MTNEDKQFVYDKAFILLTQFAVEFNNLGTAEQRDDLFSVVDGVLSLVNAVLGPEVRSELKQLFNRLIAS